MSRFYGLYRLFLSIFKTYTMNKKILIVGSCGVSGLIQAKMEGLIHDNPDIVIMTPEEAKLNGSIDYYKVKIPLEHPSIEALKHKPSRAERRKKKRKNKNK